MKLRCIHPGSTLLVKDHVYTVVDVHVEADCLLYEVDGCRGFLFGKWRFEEVSDEPTQEG